MVLAWIVVLLLAIPLLMVSAECVAALGYKPGADETPCSPPTTVLIPAHDEAHGIAATLVAVRAQLGPADRVIVVADNCSDATADIARAGGAQVIERHDPECRGKGFALAFGRDFLRLDPPAVVIILDADSVPAAGAIQRLAARAARENTALQGLYLLDPPATGGVVAVSTLAFRLKNFVRQRGLQRLTGSALLQGCGMAFPWQMFRTAPLATASLVEDLQLGIDLYLRGDRVGFEELACFLSASSGRAATASQRTRWEHGYLATAPRLVAALMSAAVRGRKGALLLAFDIAVPPLGLLIPATMAALGLLGLAMLAGATPLPFALLLGSVAGFAVCLALVWRRWGQDLLPARSLYRLPGYLVWKMPIHLRFLVRREQRWVRTSREPQE